MLYARTPRGAQWRFLTKRKSPLFVISAAAEPMVAGRHDLLVIPASDGSHKVMWKDCRVLNLALPEHLPQAGRYYEWWYCRLKSADEGAGGNNSKPVAGGL